jgi:hypothetical protein
VTMGAVGSASSAQSHHQNAGQPASRRAVNIASWLCPEFRTLPYSSHRSAVMKVRVATG